MIDLVVGIFTVYDIVQIYIGYIIGWICEKMINIEEGL